MIKVLVVKAVVNAFLQVGIVLYWQINIWYRLIKDVFHYTFDDLQVSRSELGVVVVTDCLQYDVNLQVFFFVLVVGANAN